MIILQLHHIHLKFLQLLTGPTSGSEYTNGTSTASNALTFVVPSDAPAQLYYYCSAHSGMGGSIQVIENKTDIVLEYTNGADNVDVLDAANAENFDESFFTKRFNIFS